MLLRCVKPFVINEIGLVLSLVDLLLADLRDLIVSHIERFPFNISTMKISTCFLCEIRALKADESMLFVRVLFILTNPDRLNRPVFSEQFPNVLLSVCVWEVSNNQIALLL